MPAKVKERKNGARLMPVETGNVLLPNLMRGFNNVCLQFMARPVKNSGSDSKPAIFVHFLMPEILEKMYNLELVTAVLMTSFKNGHGVFSLPTWSSTPRCMMHS